MNKKIVVQYDNAPSYRPSNDPVVVSEGQKDRRSIEVVEKPPNSPDFDIWDLRFFRTIQSLQYCKATRNVAELIDAAQVTFDEFSPQKLSNNFLTLQKYLYLSMKTHGGNNYKLLYLHKNKRLSHRDVLHDIACEPQMYNLARNLLNELK